MSSVEPCSGDADGPVRIGPQRNRIASMRIDVYTSTGFHYCISSLD